MKKAVLLAALLCLPILALAQANNYEITVNRKKAGFNQSNKDAITSSSQTWSGEIKIRNKSFKPSPEIEVQYVIFIRRQQLGATAGSAEHVEKVKGSQKVDTIKSGETIIIATKEVKLRAEKLDDNWYFSGGGIAKAEDGILGVWVRIMQDGEQIAEYVNPTSLKAKQKWE